MQRKDKFTLISLSLLVLISFGLYFFSPYLNQLAAETTNGEALATKNVFQPSFKSSRLLATNVPIESRKIEMVPTYSGQQGITPERLIIPKLDIDAPIDGVGILPDGRMGVPDDGDTIGWFNRGPKPGATGQSVLAGHVNDRNGPAVFYQLDQLDIGDVVTVQSETGEERHFEVIDKQIYPYDTRELDDIFGLRTTSNLNLITCTGEFDQVVRTHRERLVVFTTEIND